DGVRVKTPAAPARPEPRTIRPERQPTPGWVMNDLATGSGGGTGCRQCDPSRPRRLRSRCADFGLCDDGIGGLTTFPGLAGVEGGQSSRSNVNRAFAARSSGSIPAPAIQAVN